MDTILQFAEYVVKTKFLDLPQKVVDNTKKFIIDTIGVGIAGLEAPACQETLRTVRGWGGVKESTVLLSNYRCPAPWAAFQNSIFMHAIDFDDTLDASPLHANVTVLPAALALSEAREGTTGKDLICAVAIGQDVACRIAASLKRPLAWTRTVTCGYFGATAAAGKILKLDSEKIWNAFGISYCQTSGNVQPMLDGVLVKRMQPAFAAKAAVLSSVLAENGITGTKNVLDGDFGFFKLYEGNEYDRDILLGGLGKEFRGMDLSVKPYPCCRMTHASVDAALQLRRNVEFKLSDIERIYVRPSKMVFEMVGSPFQIRKDPQVDAQFSIPYTVAVALMKGDVFISDFEEKNIRDSGIKALADKIEVVADLTIDHRDIMHCSVEAKMKEGGIIRSAVSAIKGNPLNPMSTQDCMEKFRKCVSYSSQKISTKKISTILDVLSNLEKIDSIRQLAKLLV
jgi:2-methylcitrate dehydratase PrpD